MGNEDKKHKINLNLKVKRQKSCVHGGISGCTIAVVVPLKAPQLRYNNMRRSELCNTTQFHCLILQNCCCLPVTTRLPVPHTHLVYATGQTHPGLDTFFPLLCACPVSFVVAVGLGPGRGLRGTAHLFYEILDFFSVNVWIICNTLPRNRHNLHMRLPSVSPVFLMKGRALLR